MFTSEDRPALNICAYNLYFGRSDSSSISLSVIVSGRASASGPTLCVEVTVRRVGLPLNISVRNRQWKTFGAWVILRAGTKPLRLWLRGS